MAYSSANERSPLLAEQPQSRQPTATHGSQIHSQQEQEQEQTGLTGIVSQFEDAIREEEPNATLFDILLNRPATVIIALSLFALVVLATTFLSSLKDPDFVQRLALIPDIEPIGVSILSIRNDEIDIRAQASVVLDFDPLGTGFTRVAAESFAKKLGHVNMKFDKPIHVSVLVDDENGKHWQHLIDAEATDQLEVSLKPQESQDFTVELSLSNVGRTNTLRHIAREALKNSPISVSVKGVAIVGKYGVNARVPFTLTQDVQIPRQNTDDLANLRKVEVKNHRLHGVNITAMANTSIEFPVYAKLPGLEWKVKIPGCDGKSLEVLCEGISFPFDLEGGDGVVDVIFSSLIENLPTQVTEPCYPESSSSYSPLDQWTRKYLAGELSTFWIEGVPSPSRPSIINDLFTGYEVPYSIFGKPANVKLIKSVSFEDVKFSEDQLIGGKAGIVPKSEASFSGKAIVDVVLPEFVDMKTKTAILVQGIKGNIQLFDGENKHFAQIKAGQEWLQTISLANDAGYKVICFFDNLPTEITDKAVFAGVSRNLLLNGSTEVHYDAVVDVNFDTTVGAVTIKKTRIKGTTQMQRK